MRKQMLILFSLVFGVLSLRPADAEADGDVRQAKQYLREVRKQLRESFIEKERLTSEALDRAALKGLSKAMSHRDFRSLAPETRAAIRDIAEQGTDPAGVLEAAVEAAEGEGLDPLLFADHAARSMVECTKDPFSRILTDEELRKLMKMMSGKGREDSLGVMASAGPDHATAVYVQYGYPAYEEGIEIGDEILSVDGATTAGLPQTDLNERLQAKSGTTRELRIRRPGLDRELLFRLTQSEKRPKDVLFTRFEQGIGYLRLTMFDIPLQRQVRQALEEMSEEGIRGLIIDLRHNPGGAVQACTALADLFLDQNLTIAKTVSHYTPKIGGFSLDFMNDEKQFTTRRASDYEEIPLVVLINGASASASEMFAGALQDHRRAILVGETSYGKGVGQTAIPLTSVMGKRFLYLTVMRYTTPQGHEVNHIGISPDILVREPKEEAEAFLQRWELRTGGRMEQYLNDRWDGHAADFRRLAEYDGFETAGYPDFDGWYAGLNASASREVVREELRRTLRRKLAREESASFVCDLQSDLQLQRATVALLDQMAER